MMAYRKKISIDFTDESLRNLYQVKSFMPSSGAVSNSNVINYLFSTLVDLPLDLRTDISQQIKKLISEYKNKLSNIDVNSFEYASMRKKVHQLDELVFFFSQGNDLHETKGNMVRTNIKNGYVVYPDDWIVLNVVEPSIATNAIVIETKNGNLYNAPHFIFFTDETFALSSSMEEVILQKAALTYPEFEKVLAARVDPIFDSNGRKLNEEEWYSAPFPGFFFLPDAGRDTRIYGDYPYGAKVYRTSTGKGKAK